MDEQYQKMITSYLRQCGRFLTLAIAACCTIGVIALNIYSMGRPIDPMNQHLVFDVKQFENIFIAKSRHLTIAKQQIVSKCNGPVDIIDHKYLLFTCNNSTYINTLRNNTGFSNLTQLDHITGMGTIAGILVIFICFIIYQQSKYQMKTIDV